MTDFGTRGYRRPCPPSCSLLQECRTSQFCIPSKFPLSYLLNPSPNIPTATATNNMVKPVIPPSNGQLNRCNNCKGTNETNPAGITVKRKSLTTPVKMFITLTKQLRKIDDTQDPILQEITSLRTTISQSAQTEEEKKQLRTRQPRSSRNCGRNSTS